MERYTAFCVHRVHSMSVHCGRGRRDESRDVERENVKTLKTGEEGKQ